MAEGHSAEGVHHTPSVDDVVDEQTAVQVVYKPRSDDTLVGLRVRGRIKRTGLLLRGVFLTLWVGQWLFATVGRGKVDLVSTVLFLFVVLTVWGYPRLQAASVQRLVGWQGEYRAIVSPAGVTCHTDHSTLVLKWSVFQGYRETAGHFVLLSRDPNIMYLGVLPKRGVHEAEGLDRLRAILNQHTTRV
ncbi:YcxB family protein [Streptomyces sp. NBC_00338]|uniref:YcxB family protein n=1 Tax=Streptomyces sp. NBC_00338 TaxID=2975715 RepID=UPI00224E54E2|nr:YcxB family protein [Streptomyces sp. NBC_00338]MCX5138446.1 YcxB family protein [Streptomyces sp. NBC_00338]